MAPHTIEPPIPRFTRRLLVGVGAGFIAILITLIVVGVGLKRSHRAIERDLQAIVNIEEPTSAAAYEMEINVLGAGMAVAKYLVTGDPIHRDRVAKDEADFDRFKAEYDRLTVLPAEKKLGRTVEALHDRYRRTGRDLMDMRDRREVLHSEVSSKIEKISGTLEGWTFGMPDADAKYRESLSIKAKISELGTRLGAYIVTSRGQDEQRVLELLRGVSEHMSAFKKLRLNPAERELASSVEATLEQTGADVDEVLNVQRSMRENEREFTRLRGELDAVLDEQIQAITREELLAAQMDARANLVRSRNLNLVLIGISAVVSLVAALVISRRSTELRDASVGELRSAFERLRTSEALRGALLRRVVSAQEEERGRIARELHDQMGQEISALSLGLASLQRAWSGDSNRVRHIRALQEITNRLADEVHFVAWKLRPAVLDDLGLHGALSNLVESWTERTGVPVDLYSEMEKQRLSGEIETTLYRVVQEALTNTVRHAHAHSVSVVLKRLADEVRLLVEDDGCGFDVGTVLAPGRQSGRLGLLGMQERIEQAGGSFEVDSSPGKGTTIIASIPVEAQIQEGGAA